MMQEPVGSYIDSTPSSQLENPPQYPHLRNQVLNQVRLARHRVACGNDSPFPIIQEEVSFFCPVSEVTNESARQEAVKKKKRICTVHHQTCLEDQPKFSLLMSYRQERLTELILRRQLRRNKTETWASIECPPAVTTKNVHLYSSRTFRQFNPLYYQQK